MSESIKLLVCVSLHIIQEKTSLTELTNDVFGPQSLWLQMTVPAILYFIQNNLQYLAVSMLDAATFQVTYQLKILTTALFSVLLLKRSLSYQKWISLGLLTIGIAIVQFPSGSEKKNAKQTNNFFGLITVLIACLLSGLAGVWFERVLKGAPSAGKKPVSILVRNIQLSLFSLIPGLVFGVLIASGPTIMKKGFFFGYNIYVWATITTQALGGLIVAMVVKYADNILKGFATSLSIILSCILSVYFFDFTVTWLFVIGSALVLYATRLYGLPEAVPAVLPTAKKTSYD